MPRLIVAPWVAAAALSVTAACAGSGVPRTAPTIARAETGAGRVHDDAFFSDALAVRKHVVVYLPPSYDRDTSRRYPVVYYLHGFSGNEADWVSKGSIDVVADSLFAAGTPEMILVMPDGDDGWYTTWSRQVAYRTCADTVHVEAPDRYCVEHERYDDYVARDVVHFVDARYRTQADLAHRGIAGLSMGGYGATILALRYPDVFVAAASHSGVVSPLYTGPHPFAGPTRYAATLEELRPSIGGLWTRYQNFWGSDLLHWRDMDPAHVAEQLVRHGARVPALFFDCGREDGLVDQNRAFDAELTRLGIPHTYAEWPGAHTWRYWNTHVRESLAWMGMRVGRK